MARMSRLPIVAWPFFGLLYRFPQGIRRLASSARSSLRRHRMEPMSRSGDMPGDDASASSVEAHVRRLRAIPGRWAAARADHGEHYVTPSPNLKHQAVLGNLHLAIGNWLAEHPVGRVFFAPFDVVFTQFDVVEPDLLYLSNARASQVLTSANGQGAPELVVEIGLPEHATPRRNDQAAPLRACWCLGVPDRGFRTRRRANPSAHGRRLRTACRVDRRGWRRRYDSVAARTGTAPREPLPRLTTSGPA